MSNALSAAEQALLSGNEDKLFEALKAMGVQNLQAQNKGWYLKQLQADRENKEQVGSRAVRLCQEQIKKVFSCEFISTSFLLHQLSQGEALTKDELQSGVDVANEIAAGYLKSTHITHTFYTSHTAEREISVSGLKFKYSETLSLCHDFKSNSNHLLAKEGKNPEQGLLQV